jgi:hypothetical protein
VCIVSAGESQLPSPKSKKMPTITLIMPDDPRGRHSAEMRRASNSAKQQRGVI